MKANCTVCRSELDYISIIANAGERLVSTIQIVVEFYASWTEPSLCISRFLSTVMEEYPDVLFLRVNLDECVEVFQKYQVTVLPCVKVIREGEQLGEVLGARASEIRQLIAEHVN